MESKKAASEAAQKTADKAPQTQAQDSMQTGVPQVSTETIEQRSTAEKTDVNVDDDKTDSKPLSRGMCESAVPAAAVAAINRCFTHTF